MQFQTNDQTTAQDWRAEKIAALTARYVGSSGREQMNLGEEIAALIASGTVEADISAS